MISAMGPTGHLLLVSLLAGAASCVSPLEGRPNIPDGGPSDNSADKPDARVPTTTTDADGGLLGLPPGYCDGTVEVFVSRDGGSYPKLVSNETTWLNIPDFEVGEQEWEETLYCVRQLAAPFDISIVEGHSESLGGMEIVVTDSLQQFEQFGHPATVTQVAGVSCAGLPPQDRIPYQYVKGTPGQPLRTCNNIGYAIGAGFGVAPILEDLCPEVMADGRNLCGDMPTFSDETLPCGGTEPYSCTCRPDELMENPYQRMLANVGPAQCD